MEAKRTLFLLQPPSTEEWGGVYKSLKRILRSLKPVAIAPKASEQIIALDGQVAVIPTDTWPEGVLSGFTRCSDLLTVFIVKSGESRERVKLWYQIGAQIVLDENVSEGVLLAAVERLLVIESESWRPKLTHRELTVFEALRRAGASGMSRPEIATRVWNDTSVQEKTIDVHIFNLRRKLNSTRYRIACVEQRFIMIEAKPAAARGTKLESRRKTEPSQ